MTEVLGSTITVAEGAICSSLRLEAMSSVSRFLLGKAIDREKLVNLVARPVLTKLYSSDRALSAGKCWVWLLPSGRRNWILDKNFNDIKEFLWDFDF